MQKLLIVLIAISSYTLNAKTQTRQDTLGIKQAALDYFEGWYSRDTVRVGNALHPMLAKHTFKKENPMEVKLSTRESLLSYLSTKKPQQINRDELQISIAIYDINQTIASAKVESKDYYDYIQLMKFGNDWKIINVLWLRKPKK